MGICCLRALATNKVLVKSRHQKQKIEIEIEIERLTGQVPQMPLSLRHKTFKLAPEAKGRGNCQSRR